MCVAHSGLMHCTNSGLLRLHFFLYLTRRTHAHTRMQQQTRMQTDTHTYSPHPTAPCPPPTFPFLPAHTQVWAKELAKHQIRVGAIAPGVVHTKILDSVRMASRKDRKRFVYMRAHMPSLKDTNALCTCARTGRERETTHGDRHIRQDNAKHARTHPPTHTHARTHAHTHAHRFQRSYWRT